MRNDRVTIERPALGVDGAGQPITGWETVGRAWAQVRYQRGLEAIRAGAVTATVHASIRMGYRTDLNESMRVLHGGDVFEIKSILPDRANGHIDLVCECVK